MLNNFLPCSKETLYEQINIQEPSSLNRGSKISSQIFQLPHYQPSHRLVSDPMSIKKVITLASIKHNNEIQLNEQALELIHTYSKYQLIFCGVYGSKRSGKSVFLDRILNIDNVEDRGFKQTSNYEQVQCLRINREPFSIDDHKKIFFVEYCKGFETTVLSEEEQKLLDMLLIISNSMIVMVNKSGVTDKMSKQIGQTALRFQIKDKGCSYWPQNLYTVCIDKSLGRDRSAIDYFFRRNSLFLYTNGDTKHLMELLEDISLTTNSKSYNNMQINGHLMVKLMMRVEQQLNKIQIGSGINMPEVFEQIFLQLYEQSYKYHTELYDEILQRYFDEERPYCIDYLIQAFYESRQNTLQSFHTFPIAKQKELEYEQKILSYIDQRERLIIEVNKKKSQFQLKQEFEIKQFPKNKLLKKEDVQDVIYSTRKLHNKYEHAGIQSTSQLLLELVKNMEKGQKKLRKRQEKTNAEQIKELEGEIKHKSQELSILKNQRLMKEANKRELAQQYKKVQERDRQLYSTISRLLKEIDIEKKNNKDLLMSKKAQQEKSDKMLQLIRQLEQKVRENEKHMREIEAEYDFNPDIERLQRQIERTERHLQNQFSKLQSGITYSQLQAKESKLLPIKENRNNNG